ncbi:MAG: hypothetical protein WBE18_01070, partial [Gammaproteobacteria bacterium]
IDPANKSALLHNSHVFVIARPFFGRSNPSSKPGLPRRFAPRNDEKNWIPRIKRGTSSDGQNLQQRRSSRGMTIPFNSH